MNSHRARPRPRSGVPTDAVRVPFLLYSVRRLAGDDDRTPGLARDFVAATLAGRGVDRAVVEDLKLIASELTTNAVQYASKATLAIAVTLTDDEVEVRVTDLGTYHPLRPRRPATDVEHGRGLLLVEAVASRWGHYDSGLGTTVEAAITLLPHPPRSSP
ncbi:ATP-binding protein [Streptomyces atriruber]|uniref:ATP-binding protein n=1 Tax=Streptomyces atriruber TaxID=545121 RepID=A0ABV3BJ79_9ACTN